MSGGEHVIALATGAARYRVVAASASPSGGTVMILAGLGARADAPMLEPLRQALSRSGHQLVLVDWEGPAEERTVASEVEAVLAVTEALVESDVAAASRLVLFGHSVGALVAALAASVAPFAGVVVYGAAARRFADALEVGARRQLPLRGFASELAEHEAQRAGAFYRALLRDGVARDALPRALADSVAARDLEGAMLFGEPLAYLRSIDAIEPGAVFPRVSCPLRAVQGRFDWVVGESDAETIAALARAGAASFVPGADHYLGEHDDLTSSMRARGRGRPSADALGAVVASCDVLLNHDRLER